MFRSEPPASYNGDDSNSNSNNNGSGSGWNHLKHQCWDTNVIVHIIKEVSVAREEWFVMCGLLISVVFLPEVHSLWFDTSRHFAATAGTATNSVAAGCSWLANRFRHPHHWKYAHLRVTPTVNVCVIPTELGLVVFCAAALANCNTNSGGSGEGRSVVGVFQSLDTHEICATVDTQVEVAKDSLLYQQLQAQVRVDKLDLQKNYYVFCYTPSVVDNNSDNKNNNISNNNSDNNSTDALSGTNQQGYLKNPSSSNFSLLGTRSRWSLDAVLVKK